MVTSSGPRDHRGRPIDFGAKADDYERHRPGFPDRFFDELGTRNWIAPGLRVLDLGTGTGSLALGWARRGLQSTGLDISEDLLNVMAARAHDANLDVALRVGLAEDTGLADESFELVTAGQCWWWFDAKRALAEIDRLLVPTGRLLICNFSYLPLPGSLAERTEALILRCNPGWPKAGWRGIHPEQVRALDEAGLADIESSAAQQCLFDIKYEGYISRQKMEVERHTRLAGKRIPTSFDYSKIGPLRREAREKLTKVRPINLDQAKRISGVTPADIALVLAHLEASAKT